jgi:hypothetical protein
MVKRRFLVPVLIVSFIILAPAISQASPAIVAPYAGVATPGATFTVPITVYDVTDLNFWQFDLSYNSSIVTANSVTEGPFMSTFGATLFTPGVIDNTGGLISLVADAYVDLPPNPSGGGVLAYVEFTSVSWGESPLNLSNVSLNLSDKGFDVYNGAVSVPEPVTLLLLAVGVLALPGMRWMAGRGRRNGV